MEAKLNHSDLSALLAKKAEISGAKAETFTKAFFDIIIEGLEKDNLVKINGLGTFKITDVASRGSVNVNTGEKIEIKGHKKLVFTPADALKDAVNKPFAMFEPVEVDENYVEEEAETTAPEEETLPENIVQEEETIATTGEVAEVVAVVEEKLEEQETLAPAAEEPTEEKEEEQQLKEKKNKVKYFLLFLLVLFVVALAAISVPSLLLMLTGKSNNLVAPVEEEVSFVEVVEPQETLVVADTTTTNVADTVATATPDTLVAVAPVAPETYEFKMVEELAAKSVGSVTASDTLLYTADGAIGQHIVAENETLTRIALKYYGDKRLWPYIVQYNKLHNPNGLCKGMELSIPRLIPVK